MALQSWGATVKLAEEAFPHIHTTGKDVNSFVLCASELIWADIDSLCCVVSSATVLLKVLISEGRKPELFPVMRRSGIISELSVTWGEPLYFSSIKEIVRLDDF